MEERAVLYARISLDKRGEEIGVQRQLRAMRELAQQRHYAIVEEITENDISASKGLHRPGYEKVWKLVKGGEVDHVVVWQSSRLMRSRADRAAVIDHFGRHEVDVIAVRGPSLDLRTAYGRGLAELATAFDSMEGEVKAERITEAIADGARRGKAWGYCPYGWDRTSGVQTVNEHEAGIVAELVDRLLAGESLNELFRDMNDRGEPAPGFAQWMKISEQVREQRIIKGRKPPPQRWAKSTIRTLVLRDANAAIRRYRKRDGGGTALEGDWPAIVDRRKHDRVVALLSAPERRSHTGPRPGARKHLLTNGIGACGVCGGVLRVSNSRARSSGPIYMCAAKGCTGRLQAPVDSLVARVVIGRLQMPDALDWLLKDDEEAKRLTQRLEELSRRLDEAADSYADGNVSARQLERITAKLAPEVQQARRDRDAAVRALDVEAIRPLAGPEAQNRWNSMLVSSRRAVLETLGIEVVIMPRLKHGPGFEHESVEIRWHTMV